MSDEEEAGPGVTDADCGAFSCKVPGTKGARCSNRTCGERLDRDPDDPDDLDKVCRCELCGREGLCETCTFPSEHGCDPPEVPPLRVVAAACLYNGVVFSKPAPSRHHNVLHAMHEMGIDVCRPECVQGFLLSDGTFADRKSAKKVARRAGQLLPRASGLDALFSEDVW